MRPSARVFHGAAWDSKREVAVVYGGNRGKSLGDLWKFRPAQ